MKYVQNWDVCRGRKEDRTQLSKLTLSHALRYSLAEEEEREKKNGL